VYKGITTAAGRIPRLPSASLQSRHHGHTNSTHIPRLCHTLYISSTFKSTYSDIPKSSRIVTRHLSAQYHPAFHPLSRLTYTLTTSLPPQPIPTERIRLRHHIKPLVTTPLNLTPDTTHAKMPTHASSQPQTHTLPIPHSQMVRFPTFRDTPKAACAADSLRLILAKSQSHSPDPLLPEREQRRSSSQSTSSSSSSSSEGSVRSASESLGSLASSRRGSPTESVKGQDVVVKRASV
jgi:hypothetical protein